MGAPTLPRLQKSPANHSTASVSPTIGNRHENSAVPRPQSQPSLSHHPHVHIYDPHGSEITNVGKLKQ